VNSSFALVYKLRIKSTVGSAGLVRPNNNDFGRARYSTGNNATYKDMTWFMT
jgi:hypothetical protein